jgi:predicted dehydrogenase
MLDYLLNKMPAYVSAQASSFLQREKEIYDYATIQLKYDDNFQFGLTVSWYAAEKIRTWYLMGSKSMLKFNDVTKDAPITIYNKSVTVSFTDQGTVRNINNIVPKEGDAIIPHIQQNEPLLLEVKHFIEFIKTGRKPLIGGEQGARVVKILEAIGESIRSSGEPVRV